MKTPDQIKADIAQVENDIVRLENQCLKKDSMSVQDKRNLESEKNKTRSRLRFLRNSLAYAVHNPRVEFVERMRDSVIDAQRKIEEDFKKFYDQSAKDLEEMRRKYLAGTNYSTLSGQLKMLNYLLS